jgi:hypothetical protein
MCMGGTCEAERDDEDMRQKGVFSIFGGFDLAHCIRSRGFPAAIPFDIRDLFRQRQFSEVFDKDRV